MDYILIIYFGFWLAVLGAVLGSFADCAADRYIQNKPILNARSACTSCNTILKPIDLIPVFSYIFYKGKCRYCGAKIPSECLILELLSAFVFTALGLKNGINIQLIMWLILAVCLIYISIIDCKIQIIPDSILVFLIAVRIVFAFILKHSFINILIGGLSISLPLLLLVIFYENIAKKEAMGGGDIKLMFVIGLFMNYKQMLLLLITACFAAIMFILAVGRKNNYQKQYPFGPFISFSWFLVFMFGDLIINWYQSLFFI